MSGLIDDVVDLARSLLGGGIALDRQRDRGIEATIAQVIEEMRVGHPDRAIEALFDLPHAVDLEHSRIAQMFSNLLENAVTYGAHDRPITIQAIIADGHFTLSIVNGGSRSARCHGAPVPAVLSREVQPSVQGLGLGLFIASRIAEAHGGTLRVESNAKQTKFTFRMPMQ
ncbi:signal transduction histidine kinase [Devosia sp. UYZn731]|uniref:sensor histidine kinase n=1 Tax=Devosia sp. UYZn731 TaxID=3156345 RepID=UPI0033911B31